jgi:hypothetical protein
MRVQMCACGKEAYRKDGSGWICRDCDYADQIRNRSNSEDRKSYSRYMELIYQRIYNATVRLGKPKDPNVRPYEHLDGMTEQQKHERRKQQQREAMRKARV